MLNVVAQPDNVVRIENQEIAENIKFYPNPTSDGVVTVKLPAKVKRATVQIYS